MNTQNFYLDLPIFSDFNEFTNDKHFLEAPRDWSIIITDIKGSTQAISEGRYKEVNTIGAATIVVARKAMGGNDFPFVFGGDGATLIVPSGSVEKVCQNLAALKSLSVLNHNLELRVGVVPLAELIEQGKKIKVGKFEITKGRSIAILKGEGLSFAEKLVKASDKYEYKKEAKKEADLSGLSCRWNPIPSRNGKILTILLNSRKGDEVYTEFLSVLSKIIPGGLENSNPTNVDLASYKSMGKLLKEERKLHKTSFSPSFIFRAIEISVAVLIFKYKLPPLLFNSKKYSQSMRTHSDFRKFDDVLRMVIDCSEDHIRKIKVYLDQQYQQKNLFYGTFETDCSLMTCYVDGLGQGQHIHFIDSENGGYAAAAVGLKFQMKSA